MPKAPDKKQLEEMGKMPSFDSVMTRIISVAGIKNQSALARQLGLTPASISDAKKRGLFPLSWAISLARKTGVGVDVILGTAGGEIAGQETSEPDAAGLILVPKVAARLSAGNGSFETDAPVKGHYAFRSEWLQAKGNPKRMVLMEVSGDSMEPLLANGDTVLINRDQQDVLAGKIYAVGIEDTVVVKQVDKEPGKLILRSFNPRYQPMEVPMTGDMLEVVRVIGRVIWWCHEAL